MTTVVAIAISAEISDQSRVYEKLDKILSNLDEIQIQSINDKRSLVKNYAKTRNFPISEKEYRNRAGAISALKDATHAIVFWTGNDLCDFIFAATFKKIPLKISAIKITKVANKDNSEPFDVYIGRGTILGNPFPIEHGSENDRTRVIEKYRTYFYEELLTDAVKKKYIDSLHGLTLGCHCKPLPCHGDVIADYLNKKENKDNTFD